MPGEPSSGLIFGVSPTPVGKVVGAADFDTVQAVCFRWTLTTGSTSSYPIPNVAPRNFDPARYELLARGFASGQYTLIEHVFNNYPASNVYDFNSRAVGSLDYYDAAGTGLKYYQALYAGDYASAEMHRQTILDHTYGLFYWLAYYPDARIPAAVR
ncbi:hypothetical protein, partial [Agrobacterium larrymoorei]|uniref:hypothetical protein n=1 Tax=Agrobacterium larrymoorei TaxID=160699 RepID=UPI0030BCD7F5